MISLERGIGRGRCPIRALGLTIAFAGCQIVPGRMSASMVESKKLRQRVLVLYLANSALDSPVIAWAFYDGTGEKVHMAGDADEPPYRTGLDALRDGWRLFQASQLLPHPRGEEFDLAYLKYEFFFEQIVEAKS